jgi:pilus assembly protein CpaC
MCNTIFSKAKRAIARFLIVSLTLMHTATLANAEEVSTLGRTGAALELASGKGTLINLPRAADAVFVSDPEIADVEIKYPQLLYVYGIKPGETSIHVMDKDQNVTFTQTIVVTQNLEGLRAALNRILPTSKIEVIPSNKSVILRGMVKSASEADQALKVARTFVEEETNLVNLVSVGGSSQITLKVKVVEMRRSVTQALGIDWQTGGQNSNFAGGILSPRAPLGGAAGGAGGGAGANTNVFTPGGKDNQINLNNNVAYKLALQYADGGFSVDGLLTALETEGLVTVLAEPNLTAISGETASFLAGGEFPIAVSDGNNGVRVEFKQYGIQLNFAPLLMNENRIRLKVNPIVSELTTEGAITLPGSSAGQSAIPGLLSRNANTTVELGNGQSFTVAGLFNNGFRESINKYPWLGDLPVLGALFRSTDFRRSESELVIIVTPYIVEPVSENNLATPLDDLRVPDDKDRLLYGQTITSSIRPTNFFGGSGAKLSGPVGFIVE